MDKRVIKDLRALARKLQKPKPVRKHKTKPSVQEERRQVKRDLKREEEP